jgi:hypothetical protein
MRQVEGSLHLPPQAKLLMSQTPRCLHFLCFITIVTVIIRLRSICFFAGAVAIVALAVTLSIAIMF